MNSDDENCFSSNASSEDSDTGQYSSNDMTFLDVDEHTAEEHEGNENGMGKDPTVTALNFLYFELRLTLIVILGL